MSATGINNAISGGSGNESLYCNGTSNTLAGGSGNDWVGCSGNNNWLFGGGGDDYVAASGNNNVLDGGAGNDQLVAGGTHSGDRFIFHAGYGLDSITGFARHGAGGSDLIDLTGFGLSFNSLQFSNSGGNCVISINASTVLTINGVSSGQLQPSDFVF